MIWSKPKSVRQIGEIPGRGKVYMEDYVIRFAKKMAKESRGEEKGAVLLGVSFSFEDSKIYQISGIVEIPGFAHRDGPELSQNTWDRTYTEIKENFTDLEIVGWFYSNRGFGHNSAESTASRLLEIHRRNFQHRDKVLYIYGENGQEDGIFLYQAGRFERLRGYYIYYEKNPEMLQYMEKEASRHVHIIEQEDDRVLRNIRGVIEEKEKTREKQKKKQKNRLGFGLGTVVAMIAILFGAAALQNQNTLNQVTEQLKKLQALALSEQKLDDTTVETVGSSLVKITVTPSAASGKKTAETPSPHSKKQTARRTDRPDAGEDGASGPAISLDETAVDTITESPQ